MMMIFHIALATRRTGRERLTNKLHVFDNFSMSYACVERKKTHVINRVHEKSPLVRQRVRFLDSKLHPPGHVPPS